MLREIMAVRQSGVQGLPTSVLPAGAIVNTGYQMVNRMYDIGVPHYANNINNLRPTQMTFSMTTVRANSKIFVRANLVMAVHGSSHVCEYFPFEDYSHFSTALPILHTHIHHMHTYIHTHRDTHTHTHTYTHTHIQTDTQTHRHTYTHTHIHTYTYTHTHTCLVIPFPLRVVCSSLCVLTNA